MVFEKEAVVEECFQNLNRFDDIFFNGYASKG